MKNRLLHTVLCLAALLTGFSCAREPLEVDPGMPALPDGTPVTLYIPFGGVESVQVNVSTKAEASIVEEARVNDLYVLIFDGDGHKIYGRYFGYEHHLTSLDLLNAHLYEGWYVENKSITDTEIETRGAVKVSTQACSDATLVVIANVQNSALTLNGDTDGVGYLNHIQDLETLQATQVILSQDIIARNDVFMKMGWNQGVNTGDLHWGTLPDIYNTEAPHRIELKSLDAKVKFRVKFNPTYISSIEAVHWQARNVPDRCWLFPHPDNVKPVETVYFDSEEVYFDGTEGEWAIFTFYMLENCQKPSKNASSYYEREKKVKETAEEGYTWTDGEGNEQSGKYVRNEEFEFAPDHATFVDFDLVLTLTPAGISNATGTQVNNALTTDAIYSVHLGDFTSSDPESATHNYNDYNTIRNHSYTYNITVNNSKSIYVEVVNDNEMQAGQEGSLLLTSDEIVNADAHYEYHSLAFKYSAPIERGNLSWYVKTPFTPGGQPEYDVDNREFNAEGLDYLWVKYALNKEEGGRYVTARQAYPGDEAYDASWKPTDAANSGYTPGQLLDINQLILLLYDQSEKHGVEGNLYRREGTVDYIRVTAFIDEFYYDSNPLTGEVDPDLWRKFVNAKPREMHILSDAHLSRDKQSDVIKSSHSIVQASIQSIYNEYAPGLRNLWGTEHKDEIKEKGGGWTLWPDGLDDGAGGHPQSKTDTLGRKYGRLNTAYSWGLRSSNEKNASDITTVHWDSFLDYEVDNNIPELNGEHHGMIYSCLSRNRDNNGDGIIDRDEVRWYMAASEQLMGMFVGNEALSLSARLYQPATGEWRAHIMSSTSGNFRVLWAEEGAAFGTYDREKMESGSEHTWADYLTAAHGESVRCVRNVGTYDENGAVKDITYSPYNQKIDEFYTFTSSGTGDHTQYTFDFSRLNYKCIREYTGGELPYHDQMSMNNRLYAKLITQTKAEASQVDPFNVKHLDINPSVAAGGYNPYCPPGYRFPNMSEALMLYNSALTNFYAGGSMPSRTYYDKGYYGSLRSDSAPWSVEKDKIGWTISSDGSLHANANMDITAARCVKDDNMTGSLEGELLLADDALYAADWSDITFNFSSRASALSYASLKLCYNNHAGNYREIDIPVENPHGVQYRESHIINVPSLDAMGLEESDLPRNVTLQAEVRNVSGQILVVNKPTRLENPLTMDMTLPPLYDEDKGLPVNVNVRLRGHVRTYEKVILHWKKTRGAWTELDLTASDRHIVRNVFLGDIDPDGFRPTAGSITEHDSQSKGSDHQAIDINTNAPGPVYSFYLEVQTDDGKTHATPIQSMQLLRFDFTPNPDPWDNGWETAERGDVNTGWYNVVNHVDMASGDYIETLMDTSPCQFKDKGTDNEDLGLDNIFAFGTTTIKWEGNTIECYYPAQSGGKDQLLVHPLKNGSSSSIYYGELDGELALRLDSNGFSINGSLYTQSDNLTTVAGLISASNSIMVGSREGIHQSRAVYKYVRVVRHSDDSWMDTGFGPGPIEGEPL